MYGMLLESIQYYLKKMYGEDAWKRIRHLAGVQNNVFITHRRYNDDLFLKLAQAAVKVVGEDKGLEVNSFMKIFGTFFVSFFTNYGYDRIIRVTGRDFAEFLNSIDAIHEHMRFGYPKMESPSFYCDDETSTGLTLNYVSKRCGFKYYVIGQIEQIAKEFYNMKISTTIIGEKMVEKRSHIKYRLQFDNQASKSINPERILLPEHIQKQMKLATFFDIYPFSFVISEDMKICMAGSCLVTIVGSDVIDKKVNNVFSLRRPRTGFTWENLQSKKVIFELISILPLKSSEQTRANSKSTQLNGFHLNTDVTASDVRLALQSHSDSSIRHPNRRAKKAVRHSSLTRDRRAYDLDPNEIRSLESHTKRGRAYEGHTNNIRAFEGTRKSTQACEECTKDTRKHEVITMDTRTYEGSMKDTRTYEGITKDTRLRDIHKNGFHKLTKEDMEFLYSDDNNNDNISNMKETRYCPIIGPSTKSSQNSIASDCSDHSNVLHLKGEMKFISSWKKVLFVCSPVISGLDEMIDLGLYMSDLGICDRSQEMLLSGITPLPQLEYARDQLIEKSKRLEENLKKLAEERKRSDELLYLMMPRPIAERLKNGVAAIDTCEYFESVTVLFSYLDGFIKLCSSVDAMEVVAIVDQMFRIFDGLSEKHDVYKFETLGDAVYMAVSGAPVRKTDHAEPMAAMAIDMMESMSQFKKDCQRDSLTITIGIHSGAAAAGLVGQKTPQYCLFGDTVNIASRLRNTSLPMRINISTTTNNLLKGSVFQTEFRGKIPLKGVKEEMDTYWLIGRKD